MSYCENKQFGYVHWQYSQNGQTKKEQFWTKYTPFDYLTEEKSLGFSGGQCTGIPYQVVYEEYNQQGNYAGTYLSRVFYGAIFDFQLLNTFTLDVYPNRRFQVPPPPPNTPSRSSTIRVNHEDGKYELNRQYVGEGGGYSFGDSFSVLWS